VVVQILVRSTFNVRHYLAARAAPSQGTLSVIIRLGAMPCFFRKRVRNPWLPWRCGGSDDLVKHITVVIDDVPQPVSLADDSDHYLVQMPHVVPAELLGMNVTRIVRAELLQRRIV